MAIEFHSRFRIEVPLGQARQRFVNRALNRVFDSYMWTLPEPTSLKREIVTALGDYFYAHKDLNQYIDNDFHRCLLALEALCHAVRGYHAREVSALVQGLLAQAEVDLDVRWKDGVFYPAGAAELDDNLVNFNLDWLEEAGLETVVAPFRKGLRHFLDAQAHPDLLRDVITDMYEAFEAMAKVITGHPRLNRVTREAYLSHFGVGGLLGLSKEYVEYAHSYRHADDHNDRRPTPTESEVEAFVYLTGVFLRLANSVRGRAVGSP